MKSDISPSFEGQIFFNKGDGCFYTVHCEVTLIYDDNIFFPSYLIMGNINTFIRNINIPPEDNILTKPSETIFEIGKSFTLTTHNKNSGSNEEFIIGITKISEDNKKVNARVIKPLNVPIDYQRSSIVSNSHKFLYSQIPENNPTKWGSLYTIIGLNLSYDIELINDTWLIQLTPSDAIEVKHLLGYMSGNFPKIHNPITHALCFRNQSPNEKNIQEPHPILTALRLFKDGYLAFGPHLSFSWPGYGYSDYDHPPYNSNYPKYGLEESDVPELKVWLQTFLGSEISKDSLVGRAIRRLDRSYSGEVYDRITDCIIGIETLTAPEKGPEITYRIGQRTAFLLSEDPKTRIAIAKKISAAYEVRSSVVHRSEEEGDEKAAEICQDYLRQIIQRLIEAPEPLKVQFCQPQNTYEKQLFFYKYLINSGSFNSAWDYWQNHLWSENAGKKNNKKKKS